MHIDFDLKSLCPVARIFRLFSGLAHAAGHAVWPHVRLLGGPRKGLALSAGPAPSPHWSGYGAMGRKIDGPPGAVFIEQSG
jgi:hypothetical protein